MSATPLRTAPAPAAPRVARLAWVDVSRGIGILLVVYGHALLAIWPRDRMPTGAVWQDRLIYAFHMPLFFVLAGLFLWPSLAGDRTGFVPNKLATVVYPYFLWSLVAGGIELAASRWVNSPLDWSDLLYIPVTPIEQYWFLYALFLCQLIAFAVFPWRVLLVSVAAAGFVVAQFVYLGMLSRALAYLLYVAAGVVGAATLQRLAGASARAQALVLAVAAGLFAALSPVIVAGLRSPVLALDVALAGSVATMAAAMLLARGGHADALASLGRASLAIYVMHTIFSAGARIALKLAGLPVASAAMLILTTLAGIVPPYLIWRWSEHRGWSAWLGLGGVFRRASRPISRPVRL